jgi:lysophospholipase L1-like esterase
MVAAMHRRSARVLAALLGLAGCLPCVACSGCGGAKGPASSAAPSGETSRATSPPASTSPEVATAEPAPALAQPANVCPPIDATKLAPFDLDTTRIDVQPPPIVDPTHVMAHFYDRLAGLARGTATDHVRIAVYGDSNMTGDFITGAMRRTLATRFGDAGHGYVALGRPWSWYVHQDVRHGVDPRTWRMFATSTNRTADGYYGFANIAAESSTAGAKSWVETADDAAPIGKTASDFDLFYLMRPNGGSFGVTIDGKADRTVATAAPEFAAGFEKIHLADGPHKLDCVATGNGPVRLFGVALERQPEPGRYGAIVDSLGVGALNFEQMQHVNSKTRIAMLERRRYDLVVFLLGTNMFAPDMHATWIKNVLADFRAALPDAPILILSPPDIVLSGDDVHSDPRIVALGKQLKAIASAEGAAFWDFRAAMGGDASIKTFARKGLARRDYVHLTPSGAAIMGNRLVYALYGDMQPHLREAPDAGCR